MNKFRFTINLLAIAAFTLAFASLAQAQATRTWVSGVGDDANPCSRTAPCKTFAGAISKTAVDGEIDALDPGGFGTVTITKAITIDGNGWGSILAAGTNGVNVSIGTTSGSNFVQLRNISINGAGTGLIGVNISTATTVSGVSVAVENCVIFGFRAGSGHGIFDNRSAAAINGKLFVFNTLIKNNSGIGINVNGAANTKASISGVQLVKNNDGLTVQTAAALIARDTIADSNNGAGFTASSGAVLELNNCQAFNNATGVQSSAAGSIVVVSRTRISRNTANGLGFAGGVIQSYGNNEVFGNGGNNGPFSVGGNPLQ
jgi:hypothetical protein